MTAPDAYEGSRSAGPAAPDAPPTTPKPRSAPPTAPPPTAPPPTAPPPAVPLAKQSPARQKERAAALTAERKRPLPPNVAMVRYQKRVALLEASPGQFVLRTSANAAVAYPASAAKRGHLVAGRIFLTAPDGTRHKVRAWEAGGRAVSELGHDDRSSSSGGSGFDLGDDPISAIIALVLIVLFLLALPVVLFLWLRRRHRRTVVAKRVLAVGAAPGFRLDG